MSYWGYRPYVRVADRRARAAREAAKRSKKGKPLSPVISSGRQIAESWWGQSWCKNLESFSDYSNRLPRGRTYLGNGSVIHLGVAAGRVEALVMGSELYEIRIEIDPLAKAKWKRIAGEVGSALSSLVELLEGRFSNAVMKVLARPREGLFPTPKDIRLSCSCPDWASMCKHVAATLYGIGARLDDDPRLLFVLRQVDEADLIAKTAGAGALASKKKTKADLDLGTAEMSAIFGIEMDRGAGSGGKAKLPSVRKSVGAATKKSGKRAVGAAKERRKTAVERIAKGARALRSKRGGK